MIVSSRLLKVRSFSFFFSVILILKISGQHRVRTGFLITKEALQFIAVG